MATDNTLLNHATTPPSGGGGNGMNNSVPTDGMPVNINMDGKEDAIH